MGNRGMGCLRGGLLLAALLLEPGPHGVGGWSVARAQETVRPEVGKPLQAAQELIKAQRFKEALVKLHDVDAVPNRTVYETLMLDRMRGSAALGAGDADLAARSFESAINSGRMQDADLQRIEASLANVYYRKNDYKSCIVWAGKALKANPGDAATRSLLIQALFLSGDYAAAAREASIDVQAAEKAGQIPPEDRLELIANSDSHLGGDPGAYTSAIERLITYYPKREYWADLLRRIGEKPGFAPRLQLDLYRLRAATKTLDSAAEVFEMAELALSEGLAGEARRVMDDGFASGVLGKGGDAERQTRLRTLAARRAAEAPKDLAAAEIAANAAKDGDGLVQAGFAEVMLGQFDHGIELMRSGIARGGLKRPTDAALHLGVAYIYAGQKAKAPAALRGATGADGTSDLARLWLKVP